MLHKDNLIMVCAQRISLFFQALSCLLFVATSFFGWAQQSTDIYKKLEAIAIIDQKVMMPMRDGVKLATDIYRPKGDAKVPIVFSRTPLARMLC
jgi:uncharacterized protein